MSNANIPDDHFPPESPQNPRAAAGEASGNGRRSGSSTGDEPTLVPGSGSGVPPGDAVPLGPGIEGYALKEEVHRGGQGIVYRAVQLGTKRQVALKVLIEGPFASESTRQRFEREIELAAALRHPNIVTILDSGLTLGRYYFAMEFIEGVRLDRYLARHRPPLETTLALLEKVCNAVNFAHQRGVIHRDLKPANILIDEEGEPHVLDFGLAKPVPQTARGDTTIRVLSTSGQLIGTVAYMSPEQAAGSQDVDVRSDVYSLGVIFYEVLTGQSPYPVEGPLGETLTRIANDEPLNPCTRRDVAATGYRIDDELATILLKALAKEPERRYQSAGELARDIRHHLNGEPVEAKRASGLYVLRKTLRRYRFQTITAGMILVMLVGFLVTFVVLFTSEREARRRASEKNEEARVAMEKQEEALQQARDRTADAIQAQYRLRRALGREHIQRGDLALQRDELADALDSYWEAQMVSTGPAPVWALRRFYLQTANSGAMLLTISAQGQAAVSPNGRLVAVCPTPESIWLRSLPAGGNEWWIPAPGPVATLAVSDAGAVAAAGEGWARAWPAGALQAAASAPLPVPSAAVAVWPIDNGQGLLMRVGTIVHAFGEAYATREVVRLEGRPTGRGRYDERLGILAMPTTVGVELVRVGAAGLQHEVAWRSGDAAVRAVDFSGNALAALADAVYVCEDIGSGAWAQFATPPDGEAATTWHVLDVDLTHDAAVFASHEGRIGIVGGGQERGTWSFQGAPLAEAFLSIEQRAIVTVGPHGTVMRWVHPARVEQRRALVRMSPATWATAADGSSVLFAMPRGQVAVYEPERSARPRTILPQRLFTGLAGFGDEEGTSLAINDDGSRAVVRDRQVLRFFDMKNQRNFVLPWRRASAEIPGQIALCGDGTLLAVLSRTPMAEKQQISFVHWPLDTETAGASADDAPPPFDFVGARLRDMLFVPRTRELLVARSNGQLFVLAPDEAVRPPAVATGRPAEGTLEPVLVLDSPPTRLACNRTGEYVAVACEDNVVRLVFLPRGEVRHRIPVGIVRDEPARQPPGPRLRRPRRPQVSALAFNPRDDVLMIRTTDGLLRLCDPATGEHITEWPLGTSAPRPMATWVGERDAMLLEYDGMVYEHRYERADALIQQDRAYAIARQIAKHAALGERPAAWDLVADLAQADAQAAQSVRIDLLDATLREPAVDVPAGWIEATLREDVAPLTLIQLAHAAYDGERFDLAHRWFRRGRTMLEVPLDPITLQRLGACEYLAGEYTEAAAIFSRVLDAPDLSPTATPTVVLQYVAALVMDGRAEEARAAAREVVRPEMLARSGDVVAMVSADLISRVLTGLEDESVSEVAVSNLLTGINVERRVLYLDDGQFFAGELALLRGDHEQAALQYQRCIDLSADTWPANWARHRLAQLANDKALISEDG